MQVRNFNGLQVHMDRKGKKSVKYSFFIHISGTLGKRFKYYETFEDALRAKQAIELDYYGKIRTFEE